VERLVHSLLDHAAEAPDQLVEPAERHDGTVGPADGVPSDAIAGSAAAEAARLAAAACFFSSLRWRRSFTAYSRARFAAVCGFLFELM
jgi:hypothetical protein